MQSVRYLRKRTAQNRRLMGRRLNQVGCLHNLPSTNMFDRAEETCMFDSINFLIQRFGLYISCSHTPLTLINRFRSVDASDYQKIRQLFDDYLWMYASRDDRLTTYFSEDFSGITGSGDFLVKDREEWVAITRQDFAQIKDPIHIDLKDLAIQLLADTIAVATSSFTIHLPIEDHILSRKTARLVLIFRKESAGWKISHSSISIPFGMARDGEVYPMNELVDRNQYLEALIAERTIQLSEANDNLQQTNEELLSEIAERKRAEEALKESEFFFKESQRSAYIGSYKFDFIAGYWESSEVLDTIFGIDKSYNHTVQGWLDIVHPEDRNIMDLFLREEVISKRKPFSKEYRIIRKNDGETRWVYGLGEVQS